MAPITRRLYTTYLTLVMLCVLATYQGASGDANDVEEFKSASSSRNMNILEAGRPSPPPRGGTQTTCTPQGDPCSLTSETPCCGSMGCYKSTGETCEGSGCICRNPQYTIDPGF